MYNVQGTATLIRHPGLRNRYRVSHIGHLIPRILILVFFSLIYSFAAHAQDLSLAKRLLHRISARQVTRDSFYYRGMFPSLRYYGRARGKAKADNNIFFTGLIAFTLQELKPRLSPFDQVICDSIIQRAAGAYRYFRNTNGRPTYNFWTKKPPVIFPNSWFLNHFNLTQALPDDLDDSAILLLALQAPDSVAQIVKALMDAYANTRIRTIRNTYRKYRHIPAYSTWFGEKMPVDFDFSVLCNALYFTHAYHLPEDKYDSATITLLQQFIIHKEYLSHPGYISPHYARTPVLLYHIARLIGRFPIPALVKYKPQLIADARHELSVAGGFMDKVILSTALIRLGDQPPPLDTSPGTMLSSADENDFIFFIASFSAMLPNPFKSLLSSSRRIKYRYQCPAYNETLLLEYVLLKR